jgi:predicted O-methyltransferase YrrM
MIFLKLKIFFFYLKKPVFYKHLLFKIINKFKYIHNNFDKLEIEEILLNDYQVYDTNSFFEKALLLKFHDFSLIEKNYYNSAKKIVDKLQNKMGGGANINLIYSIILNYDYKTILETGVAFGWSSLSALSSLKYKNNTKLVSVDMPYPNFLSSQYVGVVVPNELKKNWVLIKQSDRSALPQILKKNKFDFCHYDSDKSYFGRIWAYKIIWNNLSDHGVLISDDISDNMAFLHFANSILIKPYIIKYRNKFIGVLFKKI